MTANALGKLSSIETEATDVVSYLLIGLACSCPNAFDLNQTFETDPLGTDITQVVKHRYCSSRDATAPAFSADVNTNRGCLLSVELDLFIETFLIGFNGDDIIIATLSRLHAVPLPRSRNHQRHWLRTQLQAERIALLIGQTYAGR